MNSFLLFLFKSTFCLSLLYLAFNVLMHKETFFRLNRMILLLMVISSVIIPLMVAPQLTQPFVQVKLEPVFQNTTILEEPLQKEVTPAPIQLPAKVSNTNRAITISPKTILLIVYLLGVIISLMLLLYSLASILVLFQKARKINQNGLHLRIVSEDTPAFSFGRYILISQNDYDLHSQTIITHEQSHIRLGHFYDLMLMELTKIIFWFNPLVYRMVNDLKEIHEFQADDYTLHQGIDATQYQLLIIQKCVGHQKFALANSFNHCQIKNRITMMNKQKTSKDWSWKVATFLPLLALLLMAFGKTGEKVTLESQTIQTMHLQGKMVEKDTTNQQKEIIYSIVEILPEFPGGEKALGKYLRESVHYPKEAIAIGIQGKVFINFIVNREGIIQNAKVVRSIDPTLDAEALRVIRLMPNWIPGKVKGMPASVSYTLPINFILPEGVKTTEKQPQTQSKGEVYIVVEVMPEFPGGEEALKKFLIDNVHYPEEAKGIQGKVYVNFIVNNEGKVVDAKVIKSASPFFSDEALRMIRSMPQWTPGKQKGEPVSVSFTKVINFVPPSGPSDKKKTIIAPPPPPPNKDVHIIKLNNDGTFNYNLDSLKISFEELENKVKSELNKNPKLKYNIWVEEGESHDRLNKIINILKSNGNPKTNFISLYYEKKNGNSGVLYTKPMNIK